MAPTTLYVVASPHWLVWILRMGALKPCPVNWPSMCSTRPRQVPDQPVPAPVPFSHLELASR